MTLLDWCQTCFGKGYISVANSVDDPLNTHDEECPECEGSGLVDERSEHNFERFSCPDRATDAQADELR